jgi:hypothetical protein
MYSAWELAARRISEGGCLDWKRDPDVHDMLEHMRKDYAVVYLESIRKVLTDDQITAIAARNDLYGGARVENITGVNSSPSSIRYIAHSIEICQHIQHKGLNNVSIVELGGGYGGLAVILAEVSRILGVGIQKYIIYDLPGVVRLQQYYLSQFTLPYPVVWKDASRFGADLEFEPGLFLVSNYCLSEISNTFRQLYLGNLLPKIAGGYFAWNWGSKEGLPAHADIQPEIPDTGKGNTIVRL